MRPIPVARRYARALADTLGDRDEAQLERVAKDLGVLADVLGRAPEVLRFLEAPSAERADKEEALATLGKRAGAAEPTRRLLRLLIERRRLGALPQIARAFNAIKDERLGVVPVETTTAVPLSPAERKRLRESLETMTGRSVRLSLNVDPAVLGGARTRVGSRVYDGTLRRKLQLMRNRLAAAR